MDRGHEWADAWLRLWAEWHKAEQYGRGYPSRSAGLSNAGGVGSDDAFDNMADESDNTMCALVDAAVSDCQPIHGAAIMCAYGVARVFRFRHPVEVMLPAALEEFERLARGKGVV